MKELPKYFVIKKIEHPLWDRYIDWLNEQYCKTVMETYWNGFLNNHYYGYDGNTAKASGTNNNSSLSSFSNSPTLITLEEWDECVNGFKLPEKWCVKDCEEVNKWASEQFKYSCNIIYDHSYLYIDQSKFPHNSCYRFASIAYGKEHGYTEITFEQFKEHVLKQKNNMIDFKVKGTSLPFIPKGTECRTKYFNDSTLNTKFLGDYTDLVSFGSKEYKNDVYILCDNIDYNGDNYFMIKESDIIKLAKEQNMSNKEIIGYKAPYDLFGGNIKANTIYKPVASKNNIVYAATINGKVVDGGQTNMPKEIVETWEPVYKEEFKVGDWVKLVGVSPEEWVKEMDKFLNKIVKLNHINGRIIDFEGSEGWSYLLENISRKATEEEILSVQKELLFGGVKFTIKKGEDFAITQYGKITKEEIKNAINYIENPPCLIGYKLTIHINNAHNPINSPMGIFKIGFGCESGTLDELKEILKAFD